MLDLPEGLDWVVVDVEAGGLFQDDGARIGSIGIGWPGETRAYPFDQGVRDKFPAVQLDIFEQPKDDPNLGQAEWDELLDWLSRQNLSAHNAKYDLTMIEAGTRLHPGRNLLSALYWDTVLCQRELEPTEPAGLDAVLPRLGLGRKESQDPIKNWLKKNRHATNRFDLAPWYIMEPYLRGDITGQVRLMEWQLNAFERIEAGSEYKIEHYYRELDLLAVLYNMEHRGMAYDHEESLAAAATLRQKMAELLEVLPFDPDRRAAIAGYFCGTLGLEPDRRTDVKGEPQIDEEQRRKWIQTHHDFGSIPYIEEFDLYVKCKRAISMWYEGWPEMAGPDGRLRCHYKQGHVKTGRMSVQRLQLQAIPKNDKAVDVEGVPTVRSLIRAREGHALWNLDLAQAELRVAAKYAKCYKMLNMLLEGADFHSETTKQVLHVDESHPQWKEKRDIGKRLTFSAIFQIGPDHFQEILGKMTGIYLPIEECDEIVHNWRYQYPEFGQMYYKAMRVFEQRGYMRLLPNTPYEIRSFLGPYDHPESAWNRIVQGSLAEFLKLWLVRVESRWPGLMILTIHDSIVMEMPYRDGHHIAVEVAADTAEFASELFDVEMKCDVGMWTDYDREAAENDQYGNRGKMNSEGAHA